ncbi:MAG: type II toxin-antitoxin system VapB family antitoxin [Acidobacteriales bacterium]|nr:type II toxin-antitoxin system VapB family antitoxin [Terriglobales bacterium]
MSLNLKNPRAHQLAAELARLTGESMTSAVIRAIEERIGFERRKRGQKRTTERMLEFAERFAAGMPDGCRSADHSSLLYGEDGLPR